MKAKCYINTRDGIITIWADPGGMDYFQGFTCKEEDLQETNTTHRSLELEASFQGAKDLPTYEDACSKLRKELDELERVSELELDDLRNEMEVGRLRLEKVNEALVEQVRSLRSALTYIRDFADAQDYCHEPSFELFIKSCSGVLSGEYVGVLRLSKRARVCLQTANITTVRQLCTKSDVDLLQCKGLGKVTLKEITRTLHGFDYARTTHLPEKKGGGGY